MTFAAWRMGLRPNYFPTIAEMMIVTEIDYFKRK